MAGPAPFLSTYEVLVTAVSGCPTTEADKPQRGLFFVATKKDRKVREKNT